MIHLEATVLFTSTPRLTPDEEKRLLAEIRQKLAHEIKDIASRVRRASPNDTEDEEFGSLICESEISCLVDGSVFPDPKII